MGAPGAGPIVEFDFGAVFTPLMSIPLQADSEQLTISDLLPVASGRYWIADARAEVLKVYSSRGCCVATLERETTSLRRPVSLAPFGGRWIAALDGRLPAVVILDELGRSLRRFPLPEIDRPLQICNLGDRWLAVVGAGWGPGWGKLLHLYTSEGEYVESLFADPRDSGVGGRAFVAAAGNSIYMGHTHTDSFVIYDVEARAVVSFPNLSFKACTSDQREAGTGLCGLFATACGPLLALFSGNTGLREHGYDLYSLGGQPLGLGLASRERVLDVEGALFYSVSYREQIPVLRIWKLRFEGAVHWEG